MFEIELSEEENFYKLQNMVLSSCPVLRKVFKARWKQKTGKDWEPTPEQGEEYIQGLGSDVYNKADNVQKSLIAKGNLEDWDLTLLALTILNLGDTRAYKMENDSVRKLRTLRNAYAHRTKSKLPREVYQANGKIFQASMKGLGVKDEVIDKIISTSGTTSSDVAFKMAKRLYDKAKIHMKKNKFERAIDRCNDAVQLPSLLANQKATTFLNRGECYLKFATFKKYENRSESNGYINEAIRDGNRALELCENSWKAHYLIGRAHRMRNSFDDAIQHLTKALAISPNQKNVKEELHSCKGEFCLQSSPDMFDPSLGPTTLKERTAKFNAETGRNLTCKQFVRHWKRRYMCAHQAVPGHGDFMKGLQYIEGSFGPPKNEVEAVRYFRQAASVGNPAAFHSLALCLENGTGVELNMSKAFRLYVKGAELSTADSGKEPHPGIAACQRSVGRMYANGIFVEQDLSEAARYYKMAADNGCGSAAHNLATFYWKGTGVTRDEKMAVNYWTQAANSKDTLAAGALMDYYIQELEPEKASAMLETVKSTGSTLLLGINENAVKNAIKDVSVERDQLKPELVAFEKKHGQDTKGLTFFERMRRKVISECPASKQYYEVLTFCSNIYENLNTTGDEAQMDIDMVLIRSKAREGSVTAAAIVKTLEINRHLIQFMKGKESFNDEQKIKVLNRLYDCLTLEYDLVRGSYQIQSKLKQLIVELVDSKCGEQGEVDMKIRFVHAILNYRKNVNGSSSYAVELLKQGIIMYSDNVHYYELLSNICLKEDDPESGFSYATKGLEKFPDNLNLLFYKASNQQSIPLEKLKMTDVQKRVAVISAYKDYLNKAPQDDFFFPLAYYGMAEMYEAEDDRESAKHFSNLGKEAEKNMLLPRGSSPQKRVRESIDSIQKFIESHPKVAGPATILQRKPYLNTPVRKNMIAQFRQEINDQAGDFSPSTCQTPKQRITQEVPEYMFQVKPVVLKEMKLTVNHVYKDQVIDLAIIEMPNQYCDCTAIHLLAEDENGDVTRLHIYNMTKTKENLEEFGFGAKIAILNPYMRIGEGMLKAGVCVDNPDCLIFLGKVKNMCRFCGEPVETIFTCDKCEKAVYCSNECKVHDWRIMKHKLICSLC